MSCMCTVLESHCDNRTVLRYEESSNKEDILLTMTAISSCGLGQGEDVVLHDVGHYVTGAGVHALPAQELADLGHGCP